MKTLNISNPVKRKMYKLKNKFTGCSAAKEKEGKNLERKKKEKYTKKDVLSY